MKSKTPITKSIPAPQACSSQPSSLFDLDRYGYELPQELIAQEPAEKRDAARLMIINRKQGAIFHDQCVNLGAYLPKHVQFVVNNSKVIPARLLGKKQSTGEEVEVFLLKGLEDGYCYEALLKPLKKIKDHEIIEFAPGITAVLIDRNKRIVRFNKANIIAHLEDIGHMPLPPYIKRRDTPQDQMDYQTVYAKQLGSVAAPTAGLHFSEDLIAALKVQGHAFHELTLHINYGTFKPVEIKDIRRHPMHMESYSIPAVTYAHIRKAKDNGKSIVAVGTTSCRVLESVAINRKFEGETNIFMYPGFHFQMTDILLTNFHLPHSTLLMLVSAFGGYDLIMHAYQEAIDKKYRFYSYGDAMLIV